MLKQLYKDQYLPFLNWVRANKGSEADAQDAYHDAWLAVIPFLETRTDIKNKSSYVQYVAKTHYISECKRRGRYLPIDLQESIWLDSNEEAIDNDGEHQWGELAFDQAVETQAADALSIPELERLDEIRHDPENWGIVRTCLESLNLRPRFILTLYFTLRFIAAENPYSEAEISDQIAATYRMEFNTNDTRESINVDKSRAFGDLRAALFQRYPEQVRYLKSLFDRNKARLKQNKFKDKP